MPRKAKHLHKYKRVDLGNKFIVFKCMLPACSHYIRKDLAENKLCQCNRCEKAMLLDKRAMLLVKPHCEECIHRIDQDRHDRLKGLIKEMGI